MPEDILESYIIGHLEAVTEGDIWFSWHGGEPMLAGIEFFRKAVEFQKKYKPPGVRIINGIQTNGTLLNEKWCDFLAEEGFVVGISLDGPPAMHDRFRLTKDKNATHSLVLKGYRMLQRYRISTEVLCVVNSFNVNYPLEIYGYFRGLGTNFLTFLPLVERIPGSVSAVNERSVPANSFGVFLNSIFDEWIEKDIGSMKIQLFEEAVRTAFGQDHTLCIFKRTCGGVPVIEHNGDFYSCDHYVDPSHRLGNIDQNKLVQLLSHQDQVAFGQAKEDKLPLYCRECEVLDMCNGECPKNRIISTPSGDGGLNYLCEGYKLFFNHCRPFVDAVAVQWKSQL